MPAVLIILGLYFVLVGWHGHSGELASAFGTDVVSGGKWLAAILVLYYVHKWLSGGALKIYDGVLVLAVIAYVVKNEPKIAAELKSVYAIL